MYRKELDNVPKYVPGKPIEEVMKEYNLKKEEVIKLASNENPLGPSPFAIKAIEDNLGQIRLYPESDSIELREVLAQHLNIKPSNLIIGRGTDEVIQMISKSVLNPGDEIITASPTFAYYEITAVIMGAKVIKIPLCKDFTHDLSAMTKAITDKTKIIYLTNPHNPTGSINTKQEVYDFLNIVPKSVIVVMDEAYYEYVENNDYPMSLDYMRDGFTNIIGTRTFSKIYGLAGLRVGYGFTLNEELMATIYKVKEPFNISNLAQLAAIASILDKEQVIKSRKVNSEGKKYLIEKLTEYGFTPYNTEANFILVNTDKPVKPFLKELLKQGIIVRNATSFGLDTCFRVTIGTMEENTKFIAALNNIKK